MFVRKIDHMPRFAPDDDGGGGGLSVKDFEALGGKLEGIVKSQNENAAKLDKAIEASSKINDLDVAAQHMRSEIDMMKAKLTGAYGKSGGEDFLMEFAKWIAGAYLHRTTGKVPDELALSCGTKVTDLITTTKAAAPFTTQDAATTYSSYLLPTILRPGVIELKDIYGNLYPKLTKIRVPAGQSLQINKTLTKPVAAWRTSEATAMTEEATPMAFAKSTISTELLYVYIQISNELLSNPSLDFAAVAVSHMLRAMLVKLEADLLAGTDSGGAPADGLIAGATGASGNIASVTFANVVSFLQACLADNAYSYDTSRHTLIMTPASAMALATQAVGASELTSMLVWGNPRTGVPMQLLGYEVLTHPACISTTSRLVLGDLSNVYLGEDASFSIDFSAHAGFVNNETYLRVLNHYDWVIGQPSEFHMYTIGA